MSLNQKFNLNKIFKGLVSYAIECQDNAERYQPLNAPPWSEMRRQWINGILCGMAELNGEDLDSDYLERIDHCLDQTRRPFAAKPLPLNLQKYTIRCLSRYTAELELCNGDPREKLMQVYDLLDDMASHSRWSSLSNDLYPFMGYLEYALPRLTALQPIRFTRLLIGGEKGPNGTAYVSGTVNTPEQIKTTQLYVELSAQNPKVEKWPAICVTYFCGKSDSPIGVRDATEFDLKIMQMGGDRFLDMDGVHSAGYRELYLSATKGVSTMRILKVEPGQAPYEKEIPNTLESIQAEVGGGLFQPLYVGEGIVLCCNEEGKLNGMEPNRRLGDDIVCGPFFLVGDSESGEFVSLTDDQLALGMEAFAEPERFTGEEPELEPWMEFRVW